MRNVPFDILQESVEQILVKVVLEVKRIRFGEVWASPSCNTFCKLGLINKEHQFRDAGEPLRMPIEGM